MKIAKFRPKQRVSVRYKDDGKWVEHRGVIQTCFLWGNRFRYTVHLSRPYRGWRVINPEERYIRALPDAG